MDRVNTSFNGQTALPSLGVIRALGPDAASFLHNQLTQDFLHLEADGARLAAWCNAKGRVLASFVATRPQPEELLLICARELVASTLKRLSMFVLRSRLRLSDASSDYRIHGLLGDAVAQFAGKPLQPWQRIPLGEAGVIGLYPFGDIARAYWLAPASGPAPDCGLLPVGSWEWAEVGSGVSLIGSASAEAYVPQMLNYESVGGVNFKKGCYPGQEVVARSQFRGTLKRRLFLVDGAQPMAVADPLFSASDLEQPCATVVQAAAGPDGQWRAQVSGQITALREPELLHGGAGGQRVRPNPAPYPLLEDI